MSTPPDLIATRAAIVAELRTRGATDLRIADDGIWIVGRAPSGGLFELYLWPERGYSVSRRFPAAGPVQPLGVHRSWRAAVDRALRA